MKRGGKMEMKCESKRKRDGKRELQVMIKKQHSGNKELIKSETKHRGKGENKDRK